MVAQGVEGRKVNNWVEAEGLHLWGEFGLMRVLSKELGAQN